MKLGPPSGFHFFPVGNICFPDENIDLYAEIGFALGDRKSTELDMTSEAGFFFCVKLAELPFAYCRYIFRLFLFFMKK